LIKEIDCLEKFDLVVKISRDDVSNDQIMSPYDTNRQNHKILQIDEKESNDTTSHVSFACQSQDQPQNQNFTIGAHHKFSHEMSDDGDDVRIEESS